jgi:hypothetical protein
MKDPWRCPGCGVWYAPTIERCECQKALSVRYVPVPQPYPMPTWVRPWWENRDPYYYSILMTCTTTDKTITINATPPQMYTSGYVEVVP